MSRGRKLRDFSVEACQNFKSRRAWGGTDDFFAVGDGGTQIPAASDVISVGEISCKTS